MIIYIMIINIIVQIMKLNKELKENNNIKKNCEKNFVE